VNSGESGKIEKRMVVEYGITLDEVWLPLAMLRRLRIHGPLTAPEVARTGRDLGVAASPGATPVILLARPGDWTPRASRPSPVRNRSQAGRPLASITFPSSV
jgi:hypothetical protein